MAASSGLPARDAGRGFDAFRAFAFARTTGRLAGRVFFALDRFVDLAIVFFLSLRDRRSFYPKRSTALGTPY